MKKLLLFILLFTVKQTKAQTLQWVNDLGAINYGNYNSRLTTDINNNIVSTGQFSGTMDFDPSPAVYSLSGYNSQFIAKYDVNNNYQWAVKIRSYGTIDCNTVTTDPSGNVFIGGSINTTTFFTNTDSLVPISLNDYDIFVAKYSPSGNFLWAFHVGKQGIYNEGIAINADNNGNIFLAGVFSDTLSFNPTSTSNPLIAKGSSDIYFAKYDNNGNFLWAHNIGTHKKSSVVQGTSIDNNGNLYVAGAFSDTTNFSTSATQQLLIADSIANFVAKYDNNGNYVWAFKLGDKNNNAVINSISADAAGNLAIAGELLGTVDFDPSATVNNVTNPFWYHNIFTAKYNTNGQYLWAFIIASRPLYILNQNSYANAVKIDAVGNTYISGGLESVADFNPGPAADSLDAHGAKANFFLAKYDVNGNYIWAFNMGSDSGSYYANVGYSLTSDVNNDIIASGVFAGNGNDFDPSANVDTLSTVNGGYYMDIFIAKYSGALNSIKQLNQNQQSAIDIYPNPTQNNFTIETNSAEKQTISVFDINGKLVLLQNINGTTSIDASNLSQGVYNLNVSNSQDVTNKRLVIVR
jgi:uncharacterized protein (DUF2249 family)